MRLGSIAREFSCARTRIKNSTSAPDVGSCGVIAPSLDVSRRAGRIRRATAWRSVAPRYAGSRRSTALGGSRLCREKAPVQWRNSTIDRVGHLFRFRNRNDG
jgi:hypothetical protein